MIRDEIKAEEKLKKTAGSSLPGMLSPQQLGLLCPPHRGDWGAPVVTAAAPSLHCPQLAYSPASLSLFIPTFTTVYKRVWHTVHKGDRYRWFCFCIKKFLTVK